MNGRGITTGFRQIGLIAVRLSLLISLWQAPIPWIHRHTSDEAVSTASTANLASHFVRFHDRSSLEQIDELGWHCHWVLPNWSHALDDTPDDEPPAKERVSFDQATVTAFVECCHQAELEDGVRVQPLFRLVTHATLHLINGHWFSTISEMPSILRC